VIALLAMILLEAGDKSLPVYIILPGAILLPLAVLYIGSRIRPKGGGH
jgi:hypothetical protein